MKKLVVLVLSLGCAGPAKPVAEAPVGARPVAEAPVGPVAEAPVVIPAGVTPDQPEFWKGGVKVCERVGKLYEYEDAYGCEIEGNPTLSFGFDGQGRLTNISRFVVPPGEEHAKLEGLYSEFYPGAGRKSEMQYHQGKAEGPVIHYHPGGAKRLEGQYVDDRPEGEFRAWDGAGKLMATFSLPGGTGKWSEWHENGARALEMSFDAGKEHGAHLEWFPDGKPQREARFEAGELVGTEKVWSAPGIKESEGQYAKGRREGTWRFYDAGGTLDRIDTFEDDSRVATVPHQHGKPVGAVGAMGKCATDEGLERELKKQRNLEVRHLCVKRPELFPGVVVLGEFAHDRGCADPVTYADCNLRKPLNGTDLMLRAGWKSASPELRRRLALEYVNEVALVWGGRSDEPTIELLPDGTLILRASTSSPVGMRDDSPSSSTDHIIRITPDGKVAAISR